MVSNILLFFYQHLAGLVLFVRVEDGVVDCWPVRRVFEGLRCHGVCFPRVKEND